MSECIKRCVDSVDDRLKHFPHCLHENTFSALCTALCGETEWRGYITVGIVAWVQLPGYSSVGTVAWVQQCGYSNMGTVVWIQFSSVVITNAIRTSRGRNLNNI